MTRGTKPKPTRLKLIDGNPGKRPIDRNEPVLPDPGVAFDAAPSVLGSDAVARGEWERLAPMLRRSRAVTEGDRSALIAVCQQWSRYLDATAQVEKKGAVMRAPSGYPIVNPYLGIANKALGLCLKLWPELGLTPSARTRIGVFKSETSDDPFAEFDSEVG